jgi:hypothetical protein
MKRRGFFGALLAAPAVALATVKEHADPTDKQLDTLSRGFKLGNGHITISPAGNLYGVDGMYYIDPRVVRKVK